MSKRRVGALGALVAVGSIIAAACGSDAKSADETTAAATTAAGGAATTAAGGAATTAAKYPAIPDGPIKLGVSVPLSGATAAFGIAAQKSFEGVTQKQFDAAYPNGIAGHKVQIVVVDDASDVTKAVNVANQFVQDKVAAVITLSYNPAAAPQQAAIFNKNKIPMIVSQGLTEYTDVTKWPYMFGISSSLPQNGEQEAKWVAKHTEVKKIAVLTDNTPNNQESQTQFETQLKKLAPAASVVKTAQITPGATDVSAAVATLKAENPDLLIVRASFAFGPIWNAIKSASWTPKIITGAGAWYDGFDVAISTGVANNMMAAYTTCLKDQNVKLDPQITALMDGYAPIFGTSSINYLTFVNTDNVPVELLKLAIEKNNSIDGEAIKNGLETIGAKKFWNTLDYNITPTNHFGLTGDFGPALCSMWPVSNDKYRIPYYAS